MPPLCVKASELQLITQQISGVSGREKQRLMQKEDREERHKISRARVKNWDNTILGHRRKKLEAYDERIAKEELYRLEMDKQYAEDEADRRKRAIDRAKTLQYYNQDNVRAFHSRVLLYQVLKERDMQLQVKEALKSAKTSPVITDPNQSELSQADLDIMQQVEARQKRILLAQEHILQAKAKRDRENEDKMAEYKEGKELARLDLEYQLEQKEKERKRRTDSLLLRDQLQTMKQELQNRAGEAKAWDLEQTKKVNSWIERKSKQTEMKKEREKSWFEESLRLRETLGEAQAKIHNDTDSKLEEQISKAVARKEELARQDAKNKDEKKKRQQDELKTYFHQYQRQAAENKEIKKQQEQILLEHYMKIRDEALTEQQEKKASILRKGQMLQQFHRTQMNNVRSSKIKERDDELAIDKQMMNTFDHEDRELTEYMKNLSNEAWAKTNPRLQKFIEDTITPRSKHRSVAARKEQQINTRERLGFSSGGYTALDTLRMNPIVTGPMHFD